MTEPVLSPAEEADADRLLDGLRERPEQYAGLTVLEAAAARTSAHMSTCDRELRTDCRDCGDELHAIRRYLEAVQPLIEEPLKKLCEEAEDEYRLLADATGTLAGDGWDDDAAEVAVLIDFVKHLGTLHPDCPGRWCDDAPAPRHAVPDDGSYPDGAPVAAAVDQEGTQR